jgi:hypothetical protein
LGIKARNHPNICTSQSPVVQVFYLANSVPRFCTAGEGQIQFASGEVVPGFSVAGGPGGHCGHNSRASESSQCETRSAKSSCDGRRTKEAQKEVGHEPEILPIEEKAAAPAKEQGQNSDNVGLDPGHGTET